ncbi:GGDEF domain-containing protein [Actinoplanes aureus]|uniref:GGDEF domain-containing protein n=1 Tax=Actinoplanes aureus TaxID=2792083 RepID=A0A931CCC4_9ACTN|nr:GGDEF domain-containing protein [Actinoplanes aureus]MBG0564847.1 GGDEF domain-containing protein [Actinoplanes aureus]
MAGWSTLQLTEFFSAITRAGDVTSAARIAVQRAAECTDAEVAAVVRGDAVTSSVGLGRDPDPEVFTGLAAGTDAVRLPGLGPAHVTVHLLDRDSDERLIVARTDAAFAAEERQMLQGMARVLGLALRGLRTLENERHLAETRLVLLHALERRERLLETLLRVQRSANQGTPIKEVLDSITEGAAALLGDVTVALVLRDVRDPADLTVASANRSPGRSPETLVTDPDLLSAPVRIGDAVAGALVLAGHDGDIGDQERRDVLAAFAEQASLALTGAHNVAAVHEAQHDPLTRLPNRTLFRQRLERALAGDAPAAVLYLDLDLFKQVNDTLGHAAGDELLRAVADRLRAAVRDTDMAARFGGDEFAVLLEPLTSDRQAHDIAQRVIDSIAQPVSIAGRTVHTRASVGIAHRRPGRDADGLVEDADLAMYRAKRTRPGTWQQYDAPTLAPAG